MSAATRGFESPGVLAVPAYRTAERTRTRNPKPMTRHTDAPGTNPDDDRASGTETEREHTESESEPTVDDMGGLVHYSDPNGGDQAFVMCAKADLVSLGEMR